MPAFPTFNSCKQTFWLIYRQKRPAQIRPADGVNAFNTEAPRRRGARQEAGPQRFVEHLIAVLGVWFACAHLGGILSEQDGPCRAKPKPQPGGSFRVGLWPSTKGGPLQRGPDLDTASILGVLKVENWPNEGPPGHRPRDRGSPHSTAVPPPRDP
jgi:hypothetical protein